MKKEILIAIFVGLSMGLIITFGIYRVTNSITQRPLTDLTPPLDEPLVTTSPTVLALHSPEDGLVQEENALTVTGTTIPQTYIVLFVNDVDYISTSDESGNFSFKATLVDGPNIIRVHVINDDGSTIVEERAVIVTDVFTQQQEVATESADTE